MKQSTIRKLLSKVENFIKTSFHKVILGLDYCLKATIIFPINRLKTFHGMLRQIDVNNLKEQSSKNAYESLFDWFIDVIHIGIIITFIYTGLKGWQGTPRTIMLIFTFGMLWWLIQKFIQSTRKSVMEE